VHPNTAAATDDAVADASEVKKERLRISLIRLDAGTQPREKVDPEVVEDYAEVMSSRVKLPPVVVYFDGTDYFLADGFHRVQAHLRLEQEEVDAEVRNGTREDACWFGFGANREHGLRRSRADTERAIRQAILHPRSENLSHIQLAKHVGVSDKTVAKYREELIPSSESSKITKREVSRNGKKYSMDTAGIGKNKGKSRQGRQTQTDPHHKADDPNPEDRGDVPLLDNARITDRAVDAIRELSNGVDKGLHPTWLKNCMPTAEQVSKAFEFIEALKKEVVDEAA